VRTPADDGVISHGVFGKSPAGRPFGGSTDQVGVFGSSESFVAVWEETKFVDQPGVFGKNPKAGWTFRRMSR